MFIDLSSLIFSVHVFSVFVLNTVSNELSIICACVSVEIEVIKWLPNFIEIQTKFKLTSCAVDWSKVLI